MALSARQVRQLGRGAGLAVVGKLGGRGAHVLAQLIAARMLGPLLFGEFTVAWTLLTTLGVVTILGMNEAVVRFGTGPYERREVGLGAMVLSAIGVAGVTGGVTGVVIFVWAEPIATGVFGSPSLTPVLRAVAPGFLLLGPVRVASAATRIAKDTRYSSVIEWVAQPVIGLGLIVMLAIGGLTVIDAVLSIVASFAVALLALIWAIPRALPDIEWRQRPKTDLSALLVYGAPAGLAATLTLLTMRVDRLLIAVFRPESDVGIYQAASQSAILFTLVLSAFTSILAPMASASHDEDRVQELDSLFKVTTRWSLTLCVPLFLVMILAPEFVILGIYGPEFEAAVVPLRLLAVAQIFNAATGAVGPLMLMTGRHTVWAKLSSIVFLVSLLVNVLVIPRFGVVGAAGTLILTSVLLFGWGLVILRRTVGIWPWDRSFLGLLLPAGATAAVVVLLRDAIGVDLGGLVGLTLAAGATMAVGLIAQGVSPEDRILLRAIFRQRTP